MRSYFFHWFTGAIWGNLAASVVWAVPAWLWGRRHFKKIHAKHDAMHEHIKQLIGEK